ncbi:glutaredoxin family protein [Marinirhabdus gelatinilytica]|uniref:Glutaredoxin n=1 Tax=Marinirhabdus gelatinilytica TaxID=1703343 RepID=A0A370QB60_9FLAO|nr:glutaredoxin domain-containing protein [Marinirhabdus gelatinilytica]RDK85611.1 glutaredoxin [Marinirhabdus gelatinilytica]
MAKRLLFISILFVSLGSYAQGLKVLITEKKKGKRTVLMAENKTGDTLNVFLMVNATGYRRSADKPVLKDIPPGKKIPMITLIEIADQESSYTYDLIVNEEQRNVNITHDKQVKDIEKNIKNRLVLFSTEDCEQCTALSEALTEKRLEHRVFNINEDPVIYRQFMAFIERKLTNETKIRFPVIWNRTETIFGYEALEDIINLLGDK